MPRLLPLPLCVRTLRVLPTLLTRLLNLLPACLCGTPTCLLVLPVRLSQASHTSMR